MRNIIDNVRVSVLRISEQSMHKHFEIEVILVLSGSVILTVNNEQSIFEENDIIIINSNDSHQIVAVNMYSEVLCLNILPTFFESFYPDMRHLRFIGNTIPETNKELFAYTFLKLGLIYLEKLPHYQINCASHINIMFHTIMTEASYYTKNSNILNDDSTSKNRMAQIIEYVEKNYAENITLEHISEMLDLSPSYVSRYISKTINQSFSDFLTYIRYFNAKILIPNSQLNLIDISFLCGFSDYKYMTNAFMKYEKCSPSQYRKKINVIDYRIIEKDSIINYTDAEMLKRLNEFINSYSYHKYL